MAPLRTEASGAGDDISQKKQMEEFFEWTPAPEPETMTQRLKRKVKQNPLVPIGEIGYMATACKLKIILYRKL